MTVTRVRTRWLIAWDGAEQRLIPGGEFTHRDGRIEFVGKAYDGPVDFEVDAGDKLVMPGMVNLHVHAGPFAVGRLFSDHARREPLTLGFLQYAAPAIGAATPLARSDSSLAAASTLVELLRNGCTTVVEIGGETGVPPHVIANTARDVGIRVYAGHGFRSADYRTDDAGNIRYEERPDGGTEDFRKALAVAEEMLAEDDPLVRPMLFPLQVDTCTPELLTAAAEASQRLGIPLQLHAGQGLFEYQQLMQRTGLTPIGYLNELGVLGSGTILAHAVYLAGHSSLPFAADDDLGVLAQSGTAVVHCPTVLARRGIALESIERYRRAGVPLAIGTDTFPRDLIQEARLAMYLSRIIDRDDSSPTAWDLLSSVTDVPATMLGRHDLGRITPGAQADYASVSLDRYRHGPVHDPISTLFHTAVADDVHTVVVNGQTRVRDGSPAFNACAERRQVAEQQAEAERIWEETPFWHFLRASTNELTPVSTQKLWRGQGAMPVRGDPM